MNRLEHIKIDKKYKNRLRFEYEGKIVSMLYPCEYTMNTYEILCIKGGLFDDVERFLTMYEAVTATIKYLIPDMNINERTKQLNNYKTAEIFGFYN
jgi:hypothetical protein